MNENDLKQRTKSFALRIIKLCEALPQTAVSRVIKDQLRRAGTSVGANYRAACRGRSKAEFIAKLGIVEEEADETLFWLELIVDSKLMEQKPIQALLQEAGEITAIMSASRKSAKGHGS